MNLTSFPMRNIAVVAFACATVLLPYAQAQNGQDTARTAAQIPCVANSTAVQAGQAAKSPSVVAAEEKNLQDTAKQLGSLFKKKPSPGQTAAAGNPCPPSATKPSTTSPAGTPATMGPNSSPAPGGAAEPAAAAGVAEAAPAATGSGQVWSSSPGNDAKAAAPAESAGPVNLSKFPDISGLRLGMSLADASAVMKRLYPRGVGQMNVGPFGPQHASTVGVLRAQGDGVDAAAVDLTGPPNAPIVWMISRSIAQPNVAHNVLVAGLRQKFGKETYAAGVGGEVTDDSRILQMWWVYDEQDHLQPRATIISNTPFGCGSHYSTDGSSNTYLDFARGKDEGLPTYCTSSYVGVQATISADPILKEVLLNMVDLPLMVRYAKASGAWAQGLDDKARQQNQEKANQAKPTL